MVTPVYPATVRTGAGLFAKRLCTNAYNNRMPLSDTLSPAQRLQVELWTSWASVLRSYAAVHGLQAAQHAVVEVSRDVITLRVGSHWLRFTSITMECSDRSAERFRLNDDGTVSLGDATPEEMDLAAERLTRTLLAEGS